MTQREPLPAGVVIRYMDCEAEVVSDDGGDTLLVVAEGCTQRWDWVMDGVSCEVVDG